jgi:hypothetical protein
MSTWNRRSVASSQPTMFDGDMYEICTCLNANQIVFMGVPPRSHNWLLVMYTLVKMYCRFALGLPSARRATVALERGLPLPIDRADAVRATETWKPDFPVVSKL